MLEYIGTDTQLQEIGYFRVRDLDRPEEEIYTTTNSYSFNGHPLVITITISMSTKKIEVWDVLQRRDISQKPTLTVFLRDLAEMELIKYADIQSQGEEVQAQDEKK